MAMSSIEQSVRVELPAEEVPWSSLDRSDEFIPRARAHFVTTVPKEFEISQEWQIRCLLRTTELVQEWTNSGLACTGKVKPREETCKSGLTECCT